MSNYYKLNADHSVEPVNRDGMIEAFGGDRNVANDEIGDVRVSTVFLVIDHSYGGRSPLLFETMIFGGEHDQWQDRYSSYGAAILGHKQAVALVIGE